METQQPALPSEPIIPPATHKPEVKNSLVLIMSVLLIVTVAIAGLFYFQIQKLSKELSKYQIQISPAPTATPAAGDKITAIQTTICCSCPTKISRSLIGTDGWVIYKKGKDYTEYLPKDCGLVVCQPCPPIEEENQSKTDCKNPRPEVCTMECIEPPPYICGSDGKSYCTVCQACSNKDVAWYEMKNSPCKKE